MTSLQDRRRVLGPADTQPLFILPLKKPTESSEKPSTKQSSKSGSVDDVNEPLPIFIQQGVVANANGSCFLEISNSQPHNDSEKLVPHIQLQASVHGPRPVRGNVLSRSVFRVDVRFSPFAVSQLDPDVAQLSSGSAGTGGSTSINVPDSLLESGLVASGGNSLGSARPNGTSPLEKMISQFVKDSLEPSIMLDKYPKSGIDVFITVLNRGAASARGSGKGGKELAAKELAAACVNAASVALVDAKIQVKDVVTCGHAFVDSTSENSNIVSAPLTFAASYMTASSNKIVALAADGAGFGSSSSFTESQSDFRGAVLSPETLDEGLDKALKSAINTRVIINSTLLQQFVEKEQIVKNLVQGASQSDDEMNEN